jgi:hypothetical protein
MQGPGGPDEDTSGGFRHGGWLVGYFDDAVSQEMGEEIGHPFDLLLGRRTCDIFASHWPHVKDPGANLINNGTKYVATSRPLSTDWNKMAVRLEGDVVEAIRKLLAPPRVLVFDQERWEFPMAAQKGLRRSVGQFVEVRIPVGRRAWRLGARNLRQGQKPRGCTAKCNGDYFGET